jgi:hypothetical protein
MRLCGGQALSLNLPAGRTRRVAQGWLLQQVLRAVLVGLSAQKVRCLRVSART